MLGTIGGAGSDNAMAGVALDDDVDEGGGANLGSVDPAALQAQVGGEGLDEALDGAYTGLEDAPHNENREAATQDDLPLSPNQ